MNIGLAYHDRNNPAGQLGRGRAVYDFVGACPARKIFRVAAAGSVKQYLQGFSYKQPIALFAYSALNAVQVPKAIDFFAVRYLAFQRTGTRAFTVSVMKYKEIVKTNLLDKVTGLDKILF
jgi:hypothetical protein